MRRLMILLLAFSLPLAAAEIQPDLVAPRSATSKLLIPAAGTVEGGHGTFFRSDVKLTNLATVPQLVEMIWLPREGWAKPPRIDPTAGVLVRRTLLAGETLHSDDFVTDVLHTSGLGAIVVRALVADGSAEDPSGLLHATSRIWTPGPAGGSMSQSFPAVAFTDIVSEDVVILGHRRDDAFRTNVGIVNLDDTSAFTFVVEVSGENPTLVPEIVEITVPPYGIALVPVEGVQQTLMRIGIRAKPLPGTGGFTLWQAFASTVDNRTGDAWSTLAFNVPK
ncbi:MAG: hypothetical protein ACYC7A_03135 [Thermoanaerobaculia bacterium]